MERALQEPAATHIFIMSDGEPHSGIEDFEQLKAFVRAKNTRGVEIDALFLGLGRRFEIGMRLLSGIAKENNGAFRAINMLDETVIPGR